MHLKSLHFHSSLKLLMNCYSTDKFSMSAYHC